MRGVPGYCKDCQHLHTRGREGSAGSRWCVHHSADTRVKWKHCAENGGKTTNQGERK